MGQLTFQKLRFSPDLRRLPQTNKPWKGSATALLFIGLDWKSILNIFRFKSQIAAHNMPLEDFCWFDNQQCTNIWYLIHKTRPMPISVKKKTSAKRVRYSCDLEMIELSSFEWGSFGHQIVPAVRDHLLYSVKLFLRITKCKNTHGSLMILLHLVDFINAFHLSEKPNQGNKKTM